MSLQHKSTQKPNPNPEETVALRISPALKTVDSSRASAGLPPSAGEPVASGRVQVRKYPEAGDSRRIGVAEFRTTQEVKVSGFRAGASGRSNDPGYPDFILPGGLRCKEIDRGGTKGKFFLDELPEPIFPINSLIRHDADCYGVVLEADEVKKGWSILDLEETGPYTVKVQVESAKTPEELAAAFQGVYCAGTAGQFQIRELHEGRKEVCFVRDMGEDGDCLKSNFSADELRDVNTCASVQLGRELLEALETVRTLVPGTLWNAADEAKHVSKLREDPSFLFAVVHSLEAGSCACHG